MSAPDEPAETFIEEEDDWIDSLKEPFRSEFLATVAELPVARIRRLPPPKEGRIPFGHEWRVLRRFLAGESTLFDPSAFWRLYHRRASDRERDFYRAFILNEPVARSTWSELIGASTLDAWIEKKLVRETAGGLRCRFAIYSIGQVTLIGDPWRSNLLRRVLVGQDSFNMAEFMLARGLDRNRRYLDVGPGSGVVLLTVAPYGDECVGVDINPRAVEISRLNAQVNGASNCTIHFDDAIANASKFGSFDLVTWNTPFVFLPPECKDTHFDAYGGRLGMEVLLNFMGVLPQLIAEGGRAYVAAAAPILSSGENLLEPELRNAGRRLNLDVHEHITQTYWHDIYRDFHEAHDIQKFEHSFLEIRHGTGALSRTEPPLAGRLSDRARELAFRVRK